MVWSTLPTRRGSPRKHAILTGSFAGLLWLCTLHTRAEAPRASTWSQEVLEGVAQAGESPELRTLRLAEEELFAKSSGELPEDFDPDQPALSGRARPAEPPPPTFERAGQAVDLAFLKGLKLPNTPVRWDRRVIEYLLFFKDDPRGHELASAWLKRRERFGPMVRRVLAEHSLPTDLQYVAMVESGYDPVAHSQAEAWGMWQFIKQPAEYYGLRVDHWADERLDPERATRAASRFMRDLHDRFGSWELAFAAYNMGYGGLLRAIKKYNTNDYWLLSHLEAGLPFETSLYVAKITALAIVANNPERFGFPKLTLEPTLQLAKIDVAAGTLLSEIASVAGLSLEQLRAVNPHLKQGRVPPGDPQVHVYLPREQQVRFAQGWSQRRNAELPIAHVVRLGETLEHLAKRTATSTQQLRELNELPDELTVKPGFALFVPAHSKPTSDLVEPMVASVPARDFEYPERKRVFYRVGVEDTTAQVARFFGVSADELVSWNSLSETAALQTGMLLQLFVQPELDLSQAVVFMPDEVRILTVGTNEFFDFHESQRGRVRVRYRVQPGDSIGGLAQRFDLSTGSLGRINQFASNRELKAGERVIAYVPKDDLAGLLREGVVEQIARDASELRAAGTNEPAAEPTSTDRGQSESTATPPSQDNPPKRGTGPAVASKPVTREGGSELPEAQGRPLLAPRPEGALPPPKRAVAAPSKPLEKAAKAPKQPEKKRQ